MDNLGDGKIRFMGGPVMEYKLPLDKHVAESKWQYCNCKTCQEIRFKLDSMPGEKIDYNTLRHAGERY